MSENLNRRALLAGAAAVPAIAVAPSIALAGEPDPIFAAMEHYRKTFEAFIARSRLEDDLAEQRIKLHAADGEEYRTPEMVAAVDASIAARVSLANTVPTTPAGLAAYLDYVVAETELGEVFLFDGDDETQDFVQSLAQAAHGMAGLKPWAGVAIRSGGEEPDPIFAAIEAHRDISARRDEAIHATGAYQNNHRTPDGGLPSAKKHPALRKLFRRHEEIDDQAMQAARDLCRTVPTTAAGLIALLQYVENLGEEILMVSEEEEGYCSDTLLVTLRRALTPLAAKGAALA